MQIHIHIHKHIHSVDEQLIINKLDQIMANQQERFDQLNERLNTVTNDIAADYQKLLDEVRNGQVSEESFARAEANIAALESLGASVENPVPEPPTEPQS